MRTVPSIWVDYAMHHILKQLSPRKNLRRTAYLDGIRGFAAFLVYWHHYQLYMHEEASNVGSFGHPFGYEGHYFFAAFPVVRLLFSGGHIAVATFFFISGYVLSNKALQFIQAGEYQQLDATLASAFFRRWVRLWIPVAGTTFVFLTCWHLFGFKTALIEPEPSFYEEFKRWCQELLEFSFVFRTTKKFWFTYNFHLWSVVVEFRGSVITFSTLWALSRCSTNGRLLSEIALIFYFMHVVDGPLYSMFLGGVLLGDLDLLAQTGSLPRPFNALQRYKRPFFGIFLAAGLYLAGVPTPVFDGLTEHLANSSGWRYLSYLVPGHLKDPKWFYLFWSGLLLIASIPRVYWARKFFETRPIQYLGRISYALYLVHGPVLWVFGDRFYAVVGRTREDFETRIPHWMNKMPLSDRGPLGLEVNFLIPQFILFPLTICVAEMATRAFDRPSIKVSSWLYQKTLPDI